MRAAFERLADGQGLALEVDIAPAQAQHLARAQTHEEHDREGRLEPLSLGGAQQLTALAQGEGSAALDRASRRSYEEGDVALEVTEQHGVAERGAKRRPQTGHGPHGQTGLELVVQEEGDVGGGEVDEQHGPEPGDEVTVDGPDVVVQRRLGSHGAGQQLVPPLAEPVGHGHLVGGTATSAMKPTETDLDGSAARTRNGDPSAPAGAVRDVEGAVPSAVDRPPIDRPFSVTSLCHDVTLRSLNISRCARALEHTDLSVRLSVVDQLPDASRGTRLTTAGVEHFRAIYVPDVVQRQPGNNQTSGEYKGVNNVLGLYGKLFELSSGTFSVELTSVKTQGDKVVTVHAREGRARGQDPRCRRDHRVHVLGRQDLALDVGYTDEAAENGFWG